MELDFGEPPGTRTPNRVIKSHLLCQIELAAHLDNNSNNTAICEIIPYLHPFDKIELSH